MMNLKSGGLAWLCKSFEMNFRRNFLSDARIDRRRLGRLGRAISAHMHASPLRTGSRLRGATSTC